MHLIFSSVFMYNSRDLLRRLYVTGQFTSDCKDTQDICGFMCRQMQRWRLWWQAAGNRYGHWRMRLRYWFIISARYNGDCGCRRRLGYCTTKSRVRYRTRWQVPEDCGQHLVGRSVGAIGFGGRESLHDLCYAVWWRYRLLPHADHTRRRMLNQHATDSTQVMTSVNE